LASKTFFGSSWSNDWHLNHFLAIFALMIGI
jgi:hypothetical protein